MQFVKDKIKMLTLLASVVLYSAIFIGSLFVPTDPDLGWHLKYGQHFFQTGQVLKENTFTTLMPDYKWNNSSWATDLVTYQTFNNFGFLGLSIIAAGVITATFFFLGRAGKLSLFEKTIIFPVILFFVTGVNEVSFRGQLLSMLFLSIMYFILSCYEKNKKSVLFLIPLFILWGNFHGEYILGLGILLIWLSVYIVKEIYLDYRMQIKKLVTENKFLLVSFISSVFAVLINPYGTGVYLEALSHFNDPLQKSITEFLAPADFSAVWWHLLFSGIILTIGIVLLGTGRKNLDKAPFYSSSLVLFLFTFWIKRYAWPFYYSAVFLFQPVAHFFEPESKKYSIYSSFVISLIFLSAVLFIKYPFTDLKHMNWNSYCKNTVSCSPTASQAVIDQKLNNDKLLTIYDYGGYLIWNYPQIKPTIDGRMHLWRDDKGYSAFEYYYPIEQDTTNDIDASPYNTVLTSRNKTVFNRLVELSKERKWRPIHVDNYAAVFVRNPEK